MIKVFISRKKILFNFDKIYDWVVHHFGDGLPFEYINSNPDQKLKKFLNHSCRWCIVSEKETYFYFKDKNDAILFKLTWGGE